MRPDMRTTDTITTRAAVFRGHEQPQEVREVELGPVGPTHVVMEVRAVGICGSDLHMLNGDWVRKQPMVLGHEGAGVVVAVGEEVTSLAVGDHVVTCWAAPCGECVSCRQGAPQRCVPVRTAITEGTLVDGTTRLSLDGGELYRMTTIGGFADHVLVSEAGAMRIPDTLPFEQAALLGCAALTGVGAATNSAQIDASTAVAVVGAGGVGQFAIQGARIAGATRIVAVDPSESRRALALELGATEAVSPDEFPGIEPVDRAIDAVGAPATIKAAIERLNPGGRLVVVGLPRAGALVEIDPMELVAREKTLTGCYYGSANPVDSLRELLGYVEDGSLLLEPLLGNRYGLEAIEDAVKDAQSAAGGRVIVEPPRG